MTNAERREKRRQAGLKGAANRRARTAQVEPHQVEPPRAPTVEEATRRAESAEEKRRANLRALLRLALEIRREGDLYYHAAHQRWPFSPKDWTAAQIDSARQFLEKFRRPDGTWDPHPIRRKGRWRL